MKWIGKNSTSDASLADITSVVAGTGLSGGGTTGDVTIALEASQLSLANIFNASLQLGRDEDNAMSFLTDNQIKFTVSGSQEITFLPNGEIRAEQFTGDLEGNADTATILATTRAIFGHNFDGSAALTGVIASANLDADTAHLSGAQTFTGTKTLNSVKGTAGATVTNILDEDAMGSDSATALATQQSIKAYADTKSLLAGSSSVTTLGTIATGVWQGTAVASAYLDADTAHLTTAQTFTGSKTMATDVKLNFRDANAYIHSNAANDLAIVATDVEIAATNVILDAATAIKLEGNTTLAGNLSVTGTTHAFASSTANRPVFSILSTADDATSGTLRLWKNRGQDGGGGANENGDKIGVIEFLGGNDAQEPIYYGKILVEALEVDDTDEAGKVSLQVAESNGTVSGLTTGLLIEGSDNTTDGEVNVTIAAGADSLTTVVGNLTVNESLRAKQIFVKQGSYSIDAATSEVFFPMTGTAENVSAAGISIPMLAPANGKLLKIHFRSNKDHSGGNQTFKLINWDNNETFSVGNKSVLGTKAITGAATNNVITCDFTTGVTGTNEFTDGETIGLSVTNVVDIGAATKYWFTAVFEFDFSGY